MVDPRSKKPFYVGKGVGGRALQHVKDWQNGIRCNLRKQAVIRDIIFAGKEVLVEIAHQDLCERDAYGLERKKIAELRKQGIHLTNLYSGQVCDIQSAYDQVQYALGQYRSKESYRQIIMDNEGRPPTQEEWGWWIGGLKRFLEIKRMLSAQSVRRYGEDITGFTKPKSWPNQLLSLFVSCFPRRIVA